MYNQKELFDAVIKLLTKYHAENAMLFGSYARNEATPDSDIDLVVFGGEQFRATDIFAIAEELHEYTGKNVDVYEIREINQNSSFYTRIMEEGIMVA